MVFELAEQDAVAGLELRARPALRDEVDPLGRAADEDDLVLLPADELRDAAARSGGYNNYERRTAPRSSGFSRGGGMRPRRR